MCHLGQCVVLRLEPKASGMLDNHSNSQAISLVLHRSLLISLFQSSQLRILIIELSLSQPARLRTNLTPVYFLLFLFTYLVFLCICKGQRATFLEHTWVLRLGGS